MGRARICRNPLADGAEIPPTVRDALAFHASLPGYAPTPLVDVPAVADALGVARVLVKDESQRLGMPSFKILGASWATYCALCAHIDARPAAVDGLDALRERLAAHRPLTLVAATDGNHGRAVARMARLLALEAHILVPADTVAARIDAIAAEGARVTRVDGSYDDAVARSAALADARHIVVSDTSWPGYEDIPARVIDGYATIGLEIDDELARRRLGRPDLVAAQIGVGAFACAVVRHFRPQGTTIVGVEPTHADCVLASVEAGHIVALPGPHDTIMAGLSCGTPSRIAWPVLAHGIDVLVACEDERAREAMRLLARAGIVSGESGAAGLAGLLDLRGEPELAPDATVVLISTEGATDPPGYAATVGRTPEQIARQAETCAR
ncbi:MAG: diaminopropionate ammonia-lyase [Solirubrobacteraceae bacterium]